jgi:hypothetical protein
MDGFDRNGIEFPRGIWAKQQIIAWNDFSGKASARNDRSNSCHLKKT